MLERPDGPALLEALAKFLLEDLQPTVKDKKLAFRVLIASNIATTLATQLRTDAERSAAELARLKDLLGRDGDLPSLNAALVERLKAGGLPDAELRPITAHVKQSLVESLSVVNPAFDTSLEIE